MLIFYLIYLSKQICDIKDQYYIPVVNQNNCQQDCFIFQVIYDGKLSNYCSSQILCQKAQNAYANLPITVSQCQKGTGIQTNSINQNEYCDIYLESGITDKSQCKNSCYYIKYGVQNSVCQQCASNFNQILEYYPASQASTGQLVCEYGYGTNQLSSVQSSMASLCDVPFDQNNICLVQQKSDIIKANNFQAIFKLTFIILIIILSI